MNKLVADSCVIFKWLVEEVDTPAARPLLLACVNGETQFFAPDFIYPEIASILWKQTRRELITVTQAQRAWDTFQRLPLMLVASATLLEEALQIAFDHDQSPYDCLYVALSNRERCPLVTTDRPLVQKGGRRYPHVALLAA